MMCDIQGYFTKGCYFLLVLSWIIISGGSQLPCCSNTQAAQGRSMGGEELRPNGNSLHQLPTHLRENVNTDPPASVKP